MADYVTPRDQAASVRRGGATGYGRPARAGRLGPAGPPEVGLVVAVKQKNSPAPSPAGGM